VRVLLFNSFLK